MQILIDTDNMPTAELAAAINMLDDILTIRRKPQPAAENTEARANAQTAIDALVMPAAEAAEVTAAALAPPPPPVPAAIAEIVSDSDPEVSIDDDGNIAALTMSVQLQAPPPPAPAAVPPATPAPPGPAVVAEVDSKGYPWDGRIHASNRAKKIDGSWKNKRGVDANLIVAVEAQNKPGNAPSTATVPAAAASAPAASAFIPAEPSVVSAPAAVPTASIVPPPPSTPAAVGSAAPAAVAPAAIDFRGLMQKIQAATAAGKLSTDQVNGALAGVGLRPEEMAQLINNAPLIASVNAAIDSCLSS